MNESFQKISMKIIRFGLVGISNNVILLSIYYCLLHLKFNIYLAYSIGYVISLVGAYYLNRFWVFRSDAQASMLKFIAIYGFSLVLSNVLLWWLTKVLLISSEIVPFIILIITISINFLLSNFWAFKKERSNKKC